ncbi:hypothetical protein PoB_005900100 [Plakobranchus ocellatus]|uniref:Uncharacterized protein n=1 Tax=Plakobranchus ocellatus TaxID=259542 RepID=A0AAV4CI18_9GAST|nr:hypothetical protein PoB_005900100 [Plakobranchus ocellatus]
MAERTSVTEPYRFQADFALNCATLMPRFFSKRLHFCKMALVTCEPGSPRPRMRQATLHAPPVLEFTFDPSTRGGRVQASPGSVQAKDTI